LLVTFGIIEFQIHLQSLNNIPLRIHVNGTRGKSSVTRLIAAGLREAGIKTYAKVTGTSPRVIDNKGIDRIIHRLRLPSIGEQVRLMRFFAKEKPSAVVMECMAVQPQYQWIAEHQMIKAHIGVITNVRPDHLEEMGPTENDVAMSLCNTVPINSTLITGESDKPEILKKVAKNNNTAFIKSDEKSIKKEELNRFTYIEHPSNIAVALDACKLAGVKRSIALDGMQKVRPDSGALIFWELFKENKMIKFVNGMAANDPVSTLQIWYQISERFQTQTHTCIFFNSRDDRPDRTRQMIELTMNDIKPNYFIIRGDKVDQLIKKEKVNSPKTDIEIIPLNLKYELVVEKILELPKNTLVFAIGNQVGAGQSILEKISAFRTND
jgi:poly-gamma-glutamate synthase PgsB/CapB